MRKIGASCEFRARLQSVLHSGRGKLKSIGPTSGWMTALRSHVAHRHIAGRIIWDAASGSINERIGLSSTAIEHLNVTRKRKSAIPVVPPPKTPSESAEKPGKPSFPIAGVGSSAGGLEAFKQLLHTLPVDTGMGFVLVQHLAPTHASNLAEILSRSTRMTVMEVRDESRVIPNHVFVIPPDRNMIISGGTLQLRPRESSGLHRSIDYFFRS